MRNADNRQAVDDPDYCCSCVENAAVDRLPPRQRILLGPGWRVAHAIRTALPGWLVIVARRHVTALADLTAAEASELGLTTWRFARGRGRSLSGRRVPGGQDSLSGTSCVSRETGVDVPNVVGSARRATHSSARSPKSSSSLHSPLNHSLRTR
jgi:hypothetical protein